jgi:hypothetical protein
MRILLISQCFRQKLVASAQIPGKLELRILYQNTFACVKSRNKEELDYLKSLVEGRTILLDEIAKGFNDENFNQLGFKLCFGLLNGEAVGNLKEDSDGLVSSMAVACHLKLKSVLLICGSLMKMNVDETVRKTNFRSQTSTYRFDLPELPEVLQCLQAILTNLDQKRAISLAPDQLLLSHRP